MFPKMLNHGKAKTVAGVLLQFSYLDSRSRGVTEIRPALRPDGIVSLVQERMDRFRKAPPGARESDRSRRERKYISAHPPQILHKAWNLMNEGQRMEFDMMLSSSSHHGISDPNWVKEHQEPTGQVLGDDKQKL